VDQWQPIGKTIGAQSEEAFGALNAVDGGSATANFVQQIVAGNSDSRGLLTDLQASLEKVMK
jgi:multiple sugar transport system substrate-binding protein